MEPQLPGIAAFHILVTRGEAGLGILISGELPLARSSRDGDERRRRKNAQAGSELGDRTRANRGTQAWQLSSDVHGAARGLK